MKIWIGLCRLDSLGSIVLCRCAPNAAAEWYRPNSVRSVFPYRLSGSSDAHCVFRRLGGGWMGLCCGRGEEGIAACWYRIEGNNVSVVVIFQFVPIGFECFASGFHGEAAVEQEADLFLFVFDVLCGFAEFFVQYGDGVGQFAFGVG